MNQFDKYFTTSSQEEGKYVTTVAKEAPEWFRTMCLEATFELKENAQSFSIIVRAIDAALKDTPKEQFCTTMSPHREDHLEWLISSRTRVGYGTEVLRTPGHPQDMENLIRAAMAVEYGMVWEVVVPTIQAHI